MPSNITFDELSEELKVMIFNYLKVKDQIALSGVNKSFNIISKDENLWRKNFSDLHIPFNKGPHDIRTWKQIYLEEGLYQILTTHFKRENDNFYEHTERVLNRIKKLSINLVGLLPIFLNRYPNINQNYTLGHTLHHIAVALKNVNAVECLLKDFGADPNTKNRRGDTPLITTIYYSTDEQDISSKDAYIKIIHLLIKHGANENITISEHDTDAIEYAEEMGDNKVIQALRQAIQNRESGVAKKSKLW